MMKIKTKTIVTLLCAILLFTCAAALMGVAAKPKAHAATVYQFAVRRNVNEHFNILR